MSPKDFCYRSEGDWSTESQDVDGPCGCGNAQDDGRNRGEQGDTEPSDKVHTEQRMPSADGRFKKVERMAQPQSRDASGRVKEHVCEHRCHCFQY